MGIDLHNNSRDNPDVFAIFLNLWPRGGGTSPTGTITY
jgi:hypothetical protein